jgi:hypothetical protein
MVKVLKEREWDEWLKDNLIFPFQVMRVEDHSAYLFHNQSEDALFAEGHILKVLGIEGNDELCGIIIKVREGRRIGYVPLVDCALVDKKHENSKYINEYFEWSYNQ